MDKISKAPDDMVRAVLIALCDDPSIKRKVVGYLDQLTARAAVADRSNKNGSGSGSGSGSRKRKAESDIQICIQCKEPFYAEENVGKPCKFHEGELEVDDDGDFWADHDEDCHGTIDTPQMREEYPEGFFWDCCDQPGDARGCTRGLHRAADDTRVR